GSPCIDNGNPSYTDPDSTVSDVGTHFYDQLRPVRIVAIPYDAPIQVSSAGGMITFLLALSNCALSPLNTTIWCDITLPGGSTSGPVIGPLQVTPDGESNILRVRSQTVPFNAPSGIYTYNAYAVCGEDTSTSSFVFAKMDFEEGGDAASSWQNSGEDFDDLSDGPGSASIMPETTMLHVAFPNPFNPTTEISYELRVAGSVLLNVYDIQGREVARLVDGYRDVGHHEVTFDGSGLASGVYIYQLNTDEMSASRKFVLMK
ncbi:MAG: T9SS type A sorting domain-containing protein, partial [bacterium]